MNTKIIKTAKILKNFISVLLALTIAGGIIILIFSGILMFANTEDINFRTTLSLGYLNILLNNPLSPQNFKFIFAINTLSAILIFPCIIYGLQIIKSILTNMSEGTPFNNVSKSIRKLAWLELISGAINMFFEILIQFISYKLYNIPKLLDNENILDISLVYEGNANFLLVFVFILLLSYVFEYGENLQQLSDETL